MIGPIQSSLFFLDSSAGDRPEATVDLPDTLQVGVKVTGSYTFFSPVGALENNEICYADDLEITGTATAGQTLTATVVGLTMPNSGSEGSHVYTWYRANDIRGGGEVMLQTGTDNTFLLTEDEANLFVRCEVSLRQTGVLNTVGETVHSVYTAKIVSNDPVVLLNWDLAYMQKDASNYVDGIWFNRGSLGATFPDPDAAGIPTYDAVDDGIKFVRASSQALSFLKKESPAWEVPVEVWIRCKVTDLAALTYYLMNFTSSAFLSVTSSGTLMMNGAAGSQVINNNEYFVVRFRYNSVGLDSDITVNGGTPVVVSPTVAAFGTNRAGIGTSFPNTNYFNGTIKDVFMKGGLLDEAGETVMLTYFGL